MNPPSASEIAAFDQAHTTCAEIIDELIRAHRHIVNDEGNRELHTVGLAHFLAHETSHKTCAELLSVAVDRLALDTPTRSSKES